MVRSCVRRCVPPRENGTIAARPAPVGAAFTSYLGNSSWTSAFCGALVSFFPVLLLISSMLFVNPIPAHAQVKIREKVTINPKETGSASLTKGHTGLSSVSSIPSEFVMPSKGRLLIEYTTLIRFRPSQSQLPGFPDTTDYLIIDVRNGDTVITDTLPARFTTFTTGNLPLCNDDYWIRTWQDDPPARILYVSVAQGDTVRLLYHTTYSFTGVVDTALAVADTIKTLRAGAKLVGWELYFRNTYNGCTQEYLGIALTVQDTTINFSSMPTTDVYPTYSGHNTKPDTNYLALEIKAQFMDSLMKNVWVRVDTTVLVDSGGHSHSNLPRPMGRFLLPKQGGGYDTVKTFTKQTDTQGKIQFKFLASQFGGIERITAKRVSDTTSFDTLRMTTRVPGLVELPAGTNYILVGAPGDVDPCPNTVTSKHYRNHYGTPVLNQAIQQIATAYDSLRPGIILRVNDMSLIYGGLFDTGNNWRVAHKEHRLGKEADIGKNGINQATACVALERDLMLALINDHTTGAVYEHGGSAPHYHIRMK